MPRARTFPALIALLVTLGLLALAPVGSADTVARKIRQTVSLTVLPQLAQPGSTPAAASKALTSLSATVKPVRKGRTVKLQRKSGRRWVTVQSKKQTSSSRVEFNASRTYRSKAVTYRVLAVKYGTLGAKASSGASTTKYAVPVQDDEFAGTTLPADWAHRPTDYTGMRECAIANPDNIAVSGGAMRLSVTKNAQGRQTGTDLLGFPVYDTTCEVDGKSYDYRYTGHVSTQGRKAFTYGFAAARIKFQKGAGQHGAFWLMPEAGTDTDPGTEIDVAEFFGDRGRYDNTELASFVQRHSGDTIDKDRTCGLIKSPARYLSGKSDSWWSRYHVFSVQWTPSTYVFRIDGKETCRTSAFPTGTPHYLVLSIQANNYELKYASQYKTTLPQHMYVDWVRYWAPVA